MPRKYDLIAQTYKDASKEVVSNPESWQAFLRSACFNYRLRFDEQLLVYAQRPTATAVLEIEKWNRYFGRWVNRGATGIAVFEDQNREKQRLMYYFDISDTHEGKYSREVPIWSMKKEYESEVIETLENSFGELEEATTIQEAILGAAMNGTEDNSPDYIADLITVSEGSYLSGLDEGSISTFFRETVKNSVAFMLMTRLGLDTEPYFEVDDFRNVTNFNTQETLTALGFATSAIAEMALGEISKTIHSLEKENRIIEEKKESTYNEIKQEKLEKERSVEDESSDIQQSRGLQSTQSNSTSTTRSESREVRQDETNISEESSSSTVLLLSDQGRTDRSLSRDTRESQYDGGAVNRSDEEGERNHRRAEGEGYDDLGNGIEQSETSSPRDRDEGSDLQLEEQVNLPTYEQQGLIIENQEQELSSTSLVIPQQVVDDTLCSGSGFEQGKMRIYAVLQQSISKKEKADFLKNEYGIGGGSHAGGHKGYGQDHSAKGLRIYKGYDENRPEVRLNWYQVEKRIQELIRLDRYLNSKEKEIFPIWQHTEAEKEASREEAKAVFKKEQAEEKTLEYVYRFQLGDRVFLGGNEYEILALEEDTVRLYDFSLPLFHKEYRRSTFEAMVQNTPINDHLRVLKGSSEEILVEDVKEPLEVETNDFEKETKDYESQEKRNFDFTNHVVEGVGKKERFQRNFEAIKTLNIRESKGGLAEEKEQLILSKYVGFGGIPEAFDEENELWKKEYQALKEVLSKEEYEAARESTLTAFYTPPEVIQCVYKALEQMGFQTGNILEPSCGTGNFIGMLPDTMKESKVYGIELDRISGRIAQQLYQNATIAISGYEKVELPDSFFDAVVGNVPFGEFKVLDKRYDKHKFLIHDYFLAKSLDKLRPGGVLALVTSKGTMDKANSYVRRYLAQRAELLGAIRLPNNTFKGNAGTTVVSDILFLQKRDRIVDIEPEWVHLNQNERGIKMNSYFVKHPDMILGEMKSVSGRFGEEVTCEAYEGASLEVQLEEAVSNIHGEIEVFEDERILEEEEQSIPANPSVRNFSFTLVEGTLYFRENSKMSLVEVSETAENRIRGMIGIRDSIRMLIQMQTENESDSLIQDEQKRLNTLYDEFTKKYGLINTRANISVFSTDSSFSLLSALEVLKEDGELERKADIFYKRTIKPHTPITEVDTASEALAVSIGEKARIDLEYMSKLSSKTEEEIVEDLRGAIFYNPEYETAKELVEKYLMADEYLSGNVRMKLERAKELAERFPEKYEDHVTALERVQPKDLTASEIAVRLGATWVPKDVVKKFMFEFLETPRYAQWDIKVQFLPFTSEWHIDGKNLDKSNVKAFSTYGTARINAYKIIEETLNLRDVRIFDYVEGEDGKKKAVLNKAETAIAQGKQELIKQGFVDWIWQDPKRRESLTGIYNKKFNSNRPREYDGSHIVFHGMNPEINLRDHQKNAVAHILYGGNTLLAHAVGLGKTFAMVAAAQESKRLGLCDKCVFVVPNHLTEQWASEYLALYPAANILVATKKDFEMKNRKKFCGRIATGEYDAIILGHSQFERIPMSVERQRRILQEQIGEITNGIMELKKNRGENFTIKQLEKSRKTIKLKLEKLNDQSKKDDVVTFEELGVDRIFIDESHYYKNLFLYTKMRNVGGIAQTEAQKSSDLFMKCRYMDEITGGRGIVFATGTTISNSMVELYTVQRYLQYDTLQKSGLQHFDAWASTFGETVTAVELTPEGSGYRAKTRFAKFYNLPELMSMFKEVADIKTPDMIDLPVPKVNFHNVVVKPSKIQEEMVEGLAERAEAVRGGQVDSSVDNMLKITNDGRKLALDQRMINPLLPDFEDSKINACVENIYHIWEFKKSKRSTQLVFCDLSTPKKDGSFSVYNDIREKLIARGIPSEEIKFIHDADSEKKKKELFEKTRKGEVRVLMGSTAKMGAGTNVQNKLYALHDIECPWRPSDLSQRLGRIERQGNENGEVEVFRYVTEQTFDAYLYQLVEGKQKFASQIMTSKSPVRAADDIDETALSYAEIKMLATGNPYIKEKMDLDISVQKLKLLKSNFLSEKYALEDNIIKYFPQQIAYLKEQVKALEQDIDTAKGHSKPTDDRFIGMEVEGVFYLEKGKAGTAILERCQAMESLDLTHLGHYRGFDLGICFDGFSKEYIVRIKGNTSKNISLGADAMGNILRIDNGIERFAETLAERKNQLENAKNQLEIAKKEVEKPFVKEEELKTKMARLDELNILLNMDKTENEIVGGEQKEVEEPVKKSKERER